MSMEMRPTIAIKGADAVTAALRAIVQELGEQGARGAIEEDLLASVEPVVQDARGNARRSSGAGQHAADTIHAAPTTPLSGELARVAIGPSAEGWYLRFQETGTSKMAAQPFLRPALDTNLPAVLAGFAERLGKRVRAIWTSKTQRNP